MRTKILLSCLLISAVFLFSCGVTKNAGSGLKEEAVIVEKYWKLTAIEGQKVQSSETWVREPHFILKADENRVTGSTSCNSFFGTNELSEGSRIRFSKLGATKMACKDMELERQFFEVLELADNYTINNDTLYLNKARRAPLARFEAVYMK